jgi:hypothetical protein
VQGLLLGGIAGLAIGSIIAGNRQVVNRSDDRIVVLRPEGDYQVIRDDDTLLRRPGNTVATETFADGSIAQHRHAARRHAGHHRARPRPAHPASDGRPSGRHADGPDRRHRRADAGRRLAASAGAPAGQPLDATARTSADADALARALQAQSAAERGFSLAQIRSIRAVRDLAPALNLESVTFADRLGRDHARPGDAASVARALHVRRHRAQPARDLPDRGAYRRDRQRVVQPRLSDRRAETVALALAEYFGVPPRTWSSRATERNSC